MKLRWASSWRDGPVAAAGAAALCVAGMACTGVRPLETTVAPPGSISTRPGYRALFRGQSEGQEGKGRFRLAVSIVPPDRLRLEFFGPLGGPRLVLVAAGEVLVVLRPGERSFERSDTTPSALERLLGVPIGAADFAAILQGTPMCPAGTARVDVKTRPAATFGRTVAWYEVTCPPGDFRYEARCAERGGTLLGATVREGISGAIILEVEYGDYEKGLGPRWPRQIRVRLPRREASVTLAAVEGPWSGDIPESIFTPEIPEGFQERLIDPSPDAPGLFMSESSRTD